MFSRTLCVVVCSLVAVNVFAQVPAAQHVVLVIDENSSYSEVMANMPWLVGQGFANGYATNYKSDNGGSLMDYLWLASGSCESSANCSLPNGTHNFNCNGNDCYYPGTGTSDPVTDDNIFRELNKAGISWKVYAQSYAQAGGTPTTPDNHNGTAYYRRHNGAAWYSDILSNVDGSASKIVDLSQLETDVAKGSLPRFTIIVPDGNHDAHDCPVGMSSCTVSQTLAAADAFLSSTLQPILELRDFQPGGSGLIVVTFDECAGGTNAGCGASVYTALIGPKIKPHTVSSSPYKHENALRTMLDSLRIGVYPGAAASAADMSDFFTTTGSRPEVALEWPYTGASLSSPVTIQASAVPGSGHTITGWHVYVDSTSVFSAGAVSAIDSSLKMSTGTHNVVARAWDSSGAYADQSFTVTVSSLKPAVRLGTPTGGTIVGSPVNFQALAIPSAGQTINLWKVYVDGNAAASAGAIDWINQNVAMSNGIHTVVVRAWDTSGSHGDQTLKLTVAAKPAVALSTPAIGANILSPIHVKAAATPSSGHSITGWWIYLDGNAAFNAGSVGSIDAYVPASAGAHTLVIRAWDTSGAYGDQTFAVEVKPVAVNILAPFNSSPVTSPLKLQAAAYAANPIVGWHVYVDSVDSYTQSSGNSINSQLTIGPGTHSVVVRAWDSNGVYGDQTIAVTVP